MGRLAHKPPSHWALVRFHRREAWSQCDLDLALAETIARRPWATLGAIRSMRQYRSKTDRESARPFTLKVVQAVRFHKGSDGMQTFSRMFRAMAVFVLVASPVLAEDAISSGKVKGVNSDKKEFVLTDSAGKDSTYKFSDAVVVNRGGKESRSDINAGDIVNVCYDKGVFTWTANYILVREGDTKHSVLMHGTFKSYDADKKEATFTDSDGKDQTFPMGHAKVRMNKAESKIGDVKIGENALAIVDKEGDVSTLTCLMIDRK